MALRLSMLSQRPSHHDFDGAATAEKSVDDPKRLGVGQSRAMHRAGLSETGSLHPSASCARNWTVVNCNICNSIVSMIRLSTARKAGYTPNM
jgi:hypothetical protein